MYYIYKYVSPISCSGRRLIRDLYGSIRWCRCWGCQRRRGFVWLISQNQIILCFIRVISVVIYCRDFEKKKHTRMSVGPSNVSLALGQPVHSNSSIKKAYIRLYLSNNLVHIYIFMVHKPSCPVVDVLYCSVMNVVRLPPRIHTKCRIVTYVRYFGFVKTWFHMQVVYLSFTQYSPIEYYVRIVLIPSCTFQSNNVSVLSLYHHVQSNIIVCPYCPYIITHSPIE